MIVEGAARQPYTDKGRKTLPTGQYVYPDRNCDRYQETERVRLWTRPDGTEHRVREGAGDPTGRVFDCRAGETTVTLLDTKPTDYTINCRYWTTSESYQEWMGFEGGPEIAYRTSHHYNYTALPAKYRMRRAIIRGDGTMVGYEDKQGGIRSLFQHSPYVDTAGHRCRGYPRSYSRNSWILGGKNRRFRDFAVLLADIRGRLPKPESIVWGPLPNPSLPAETAQVDG